MKYVIIEKKDSDRYVLYDTENKGMCCVSKYTLQQLRDNKHTIIGLISKSGTVKTGDIVVMTMDGKIRTKMVTYDVPDTKRSAVTVERGIKPDKRESDIYQIQFVHVKRVPLNWDGNIKSLPKENIYYSKQMYGLRLGNGCYYMEDSSIYSGNTQLKQIASLVAVNNKKIETILKRAYTSYQRAVKINEQIESLKEQRCKELHICGSASEDIMQALGYLTKEQFLCEFKSNLSDYVAAKIEDYKYSISLYSNTIEIERDKDIEKYFREGSFIYEEYDGSIQLIENCEKDKSYQAYLEKYKKELPIKRKPDYAYLLAGGDKDYLSCHTRYELNVTEFTKKEAKELAENFCK